jgi:PAS domain S-box-containing protein
MKSLLKVALKNKGTSFDGFPNILEDNNKKLCQNKLGNLALLQFLIIAVGQRLARSRQINLNNARNTYFYKVSQDVLKEFVHMTPNCMALLDKKLNYISVSKSWKNNPFLHSKGSNPIGKSYKEFSPYQTPEWLKILEQALQGTAAEEETLCQLPDGREQWMQWQVQPWDEDAGKIGGLALMSEDITDKKVLLEQANRLIKEKHELESFAYMCPHDLQSHIKTLSNFISFVAKGEHRRKDSDVQEYYKYIFEALENMKNLIDDCLLHAQIHTESLIKFPQDLNEIVSSVLAMLKAPIQSKRAQIRCDSLPTVWCHKQTIKQVFENLITNALKFCYKQPYIHIFAEETEKEWIIHFHDNGIGISIDDQEKLFQSFYRIHSKDKFPGTGLGLSFCKKIIELHEGHIWVKSSEGRGSTFSLSFPKRNDYNDNFARLGNPAASTQ